MSLAWETIGLFIVLLAGAAFLLRHPAGRPRSAVIAQAGYPLQEGGWRVELRGQVVADLDFVRSDDPHRFTFQARLLTRDQGKINDVFDEQRGTSKEDIVFRNLGFPYQADGTELCASLKPPGLAEIRVVGGEERARQFLAKFKIRQR